MAKILSVYNRLQAGDYENSNGGKRRVSQLTQVYPRNASIDIIGHGLGSTRWYGSHRDIVLLKCKLFIWKINVLVYN